MRKTLGTYINQGGKVITNTYNIVDEITLQNYLLTNYGDRIIRKYIDPSISGQNILDMYAPYLDKIFNLSENYDIFNPEHEETTRTMDYTKQNDGTINVTNSKNGESSTSASKNSSFDNSKDYTETFEHGEIIDRTFENDGTLKDIGTNTGKENTTTDRIQTVEITDNITNSGTLLKDVSAYNQTQDYAPRDRETENNTKDENRKEELTENITGEKTISGSNNLDRTTNDTGESKDTHSGTDTRKGNETDSGKNNETTTGSTTTSETGKSDTTQSGNESYNLNEHIIREGHITYEEILNTLENIFNPYKWLGDKIVNAICELYYPTKKWYDWYEKENNI